MQRGASFGSVRFLAVAAAVVLLASIALVATPAAGASDPCQSPTISGTSGADYLVGTNNPDVIAGLAGDDTIRGLGGNDVICGGDGDDLINGGLGNDQVFGQAGNDEIQMSDPVLYCSTAASGFNPTAETSGLTGEDPNSPAWNDCNPASGPSPSRATIPDGGSLNETMNLTIPAGATDIRDINVRFYVNAPAVGTPSHADPCQLYIFTTSATNVQNDMVGKVGGQTFTPSCNATGTDLTGTSLDSEAIVSMNNLGPGSSGANSSMNGRFHPSGSLERIYRGIPVCAGSPCTWKLTLRDMNADGHTGSLSWWALEINYRQSSSDGTDTINCGSGSKDTADYTARSTKIVATLADGLANDGQANEADNLGVDDTNRCEWLYSGTAADKLTGNKAANDLRGEDGNDVVKGLAGQDNLEGAAGNDKLTGGQAFDTMDGGAGTDTCADSGDYRNNCETLTS